MLASPHNPNLYIRDPMNLPFRTALNPAWWFGTLILFFHSVGNVIIPTGFSYFSEGLKPPTSIYPISYNLAIRTALNHMKITKGIQRVARAQP